MPGRLTLERAVSFKDYVALGFGVMIGVGWVVYAGQWVLSGGSLGALLAFIVGGVLLIPIGKCYAELTSAMPVTGGEIAFVYRAYGRPWAFLAAWALSLSYISITPFETIAIGSMTEAIFPSLATRPIYHVNGDAISWTTIIAGLAAGCWVIWLHRRGTADIVRFQRLTVYGLIATAIAFCGIAVWNGQLDHFQPLFVGDDNLWVAALSSIVSVIVVVPFFLAGFDCIPQAAEESMQIERRSLGTAIIVAIIIGTIFYVLIIVALSMTASRDAILAIEAQGHKLPMAEIFRIAFGHEWLAKLVLITGLLGLISSLNGFFMASTRLIFALGRGGFIPGWFSELDSVRRTPMNAVHFVGVIALTGPFLGTAGLSLIVSSSSFTFIAVLFLTSLSAYKLRQTAPEMTRPYKVSIRTIYLAILVASALLALMLLPGSPGQLGAAEFVWVSLWMLIGFVFYRYRTKRNPMSQEDQSFQVLGDYGQ